MSERPVTAPCTEATAPIDASERSTAGISGPRTRTSRSTKGAAAARISRHQSRALRKENAASRLAKSPPRRENELIPAPYLWR